MNRVRARTLVLVNWKGVFYERYALDDNVTALEGDNGAGKTTVMIAAYVTLLPDMSRLRFTNVGESDATGGDKGIWGRLGNPNRPSYAALAFDLGGEQVIAGVHLERKGEPSVELTPFLISDLQETVRLHEILLVNSVDQELVPELDDLRENVTRLGGRIHVFRTAKEYFGALFERGITPLRLVADEERSRLNDMLRTSMTGGISRALTSEFRSFLLKEETGLADTLVRMRANLDACRRTRVEVNEARELEKEISGVYDAGHRMFAASLLATRDRAAELRRRVEDARKRRDEARREYDAVARERDERIEEHADVELRLTEARVQHEAAHTLLEQITKAHTIATRLLGLDTELRDLGFALADATAELEQAENLKARRLEDRSRAEAAYHNAAEGLADVQRGLEELHRRADAHHRVMRRLEEARASLDLPDLAVADLQTQQKNTELALRVIDCERNDLDAVIRGAELHRAEHAEAMHALTHILGRHVDARDAEAEARMALQRLTELEFVAGGGVAIEDELRRTRVLAQRQLAAQAAAKSLAMTGRGFASPEEVSEAVHQTQLQLNALEHQIRDDEFKAEDCRRAQGALAERKAALEARGVRWRELDGIARRLEATLGAGLRNAQDLDAARQRLDAERDGLQRMLESRESERREAMDRARVLEQTGGDFHRDLLAACDIVDGELLAGRFDDVDPSQAGMMQARLGPLADALIVEDAHESAAMLDGHDRELDTIWFVEERGLHQLADANCGEQMKNDVVVEHGGVVRTTRMPERPTLGRKARQRLVAELRARAEELGIRIDELETNLAEADSRRRDTTLLTRELTTLEGGDPSLELASTVDDLAQHVARREAHIAAANEARAHTSRLADRAEKLRALLGEAFLLQERDLVAKVGELEASLHSAFRAGAELTRVASARQTLHGRIEVLRRLPLSESDIERKQDALGQLNRRRERLFIALDALGYVDDNREAVAWTDAAAELSTSRELVPGLKAQLENAESNKRQATEAAEQADRAWDEARTSWRRIDDRRSAIEASREQAMRELVATGVEDASERAVQRARETVQELGTLAETLDHTERRLGELIAQLRERLESRGRVFEEAQEHLLREERESKPAEELWERLRARAESRGLITPSIAQRLLEAGTGSVNLRSEARSMEKILEERLSNARGGREILERIRSRLSPEDQTTGDGDIEVWELVRDWLRRRVPAQIAEVDDPLEALQRLRQRLGALSERLESQEAELRGASEDVARGIDVHIRSAHRQVRLLNHELTGVHFGTIGGMRIRLARDDRMEGVLNALREGSAQELLFAPNMPVEEAFNALFERYGGRGPTLGQKLLDYREYVQIAVEVQRQGSAEWERVNPSRLSTGEAIGVGTALMMVVLTAWEQAANIFRAKRSLGTLRLLFLDEANRLSQDNLEVLFELCTTLDLQLMIASPEVARAQGCTTYRLVRRVTTDGGEEVVVSGRRSITDAPHHVDE